MGNLERNCRHSILSTRASQTRRPGASCPISQKGWIRLCLIRKSRSVAAFGLSRIPWWTPRTRSSSLAKRIVSVVRAFSIAFGRGGSVREMVANASHSGLVIPPSSMSGVHSRNLNLFMLPIRNGYRVRDHACRIFAFSRYILECKRRHFRCVKCAVCTPLSSAAHSVCSYWRACFLELHLYHIMFASAYAIYRYREVCHIQCSNVFVDEILLVPSRR